MLMTLMEACILMALLKVVNDEDAGLFMACVIALGGAIGTNVCISLMFLALGIPGIILGGVISIGLLGVLISALYGVEIMRSFLIGTVFVCAHIGIAIAFLTTFQ